MRAIGCTAAALLVVAAPAAVARPDSPPQTAKTDPAAVRVEPDKSWNAVFTRPDGWSGADVAGTVVLGDGRVVWLFGDTWIGTIRNGKRTPGSRMVNNSIAVHPLDRSAPWTAPDPSAVHFYWGPADRDGHPTAWVRPAEQPGDHQAGEQSREWLWTTGGGLAVRSPSGSLKLFVFFFRVAKNAQEKGVWGFTVVGTAVGVIDNAVEASDRCNVRLVNLPNELISLSRKANGAKDAPADAELTWGMATCVDPDSLGRNSPDALIYGVRRTAFGNRQLVLARAPAASIDRFDTWKFYSGKNSWSPTPAAAVPLASGIAPEFSVERLEDRTCVIWTLVQSEPFLGKRILLRRAPRADGPWSSPTFLARVSDVERSRSYFTYAAKGHAALSRPGELLITYVVNSNQFADLMEDMQIYRPKFLRVIAPSLFSRQI
ncbi:MAG TPA: hypothetical protein VHX68_11995, partial [Planctomycetaceae bacterium]|nr:hypothetical protein [Planctomycetaceae bacterium]